MSEINLNSFFDRLVNFKIKFTKEPSPIQVANADLHFFIGEEEIQFDSIEYYQHLELVVIRFKGDVEK